jgi:hypothetical protein
MGGPSNRKIGIASGGVYPGVVEARPLGPLESWPGVSDRDRNIFMRAKVLLIENQADSM